MDRRRFLGLIGATCAFSYWGCSTEPTLPNVLFVLADDLGWSQLGCYGSSFYDTPNLDRLADQGMRFTDAYAAAPVCSPTRASILTGKYPARLHLTDFIAGNPFPWNPLKQPDWTKHLPLEEVTIAEVMKKAGYATASFGKWHLSVTKKPPESLPYNPDKQGFDKSFVTYKPTRDQNPEDDAHNVTAITDKAVDFMKRHRNRPFFLYITHNSIHNPLKEKSDLIAKYKNKRGVDLPENRPVIGAMLETLDASVGALLQTLDQLQLAENTIVIFFSDNGGLESDADQTPLRAGKATLYEGGIRVPLIVRWPGVVEPRSVCREPVISIDFFPTLTDILGINNPEDIDGQSILPLLKQHESLNRKAIFWHYPHYHTAGIGPASAVRAGNYKLIERHEGTLLGQGNQVELYHLGNDIEERHNLAERLPEKAEELAAILREWRHSVGAQMPVKNPDYDPEKAGQSR